MKMLALVIPGMISGMLQFLLYVRAPTPVEA